ncbi:MAG: hypothetical protein IJC93_02985 [Clostridia bacterium]|nr:hypothetical protein [Clostridia bacterium]
MAVFNLSGGGVASRELVPENIRDGVTIGNVTGTLPPTVVLTKVEYNALAEKDGNTLYLVVA